MDIDVGKGGNGSTERGLVFRPLVCTIAHRRIERGHMTQDFVPVTDSPRDGHDLYRSDPKVKLKASIALNLHPISFILHRHKETHEQTADFTTN